MREHIDLKWRGEGLGGMTLLAIETLLKPKRHAVDMYTKTTLLRSQRNRCNLCGEPMRMGDAQADHIIPLSAGGTKLQIVCRDCHQQKSASELDSARPWDPFTSTFNKAAHKAFASAEVPRTPPREYRVG